MKSTALPLSGIALSALLSASVAGLSPAAADTALTVGKAIRTAPMTIPVDVGYQAGIFKKHGLDVNIVEFSGGSKAMQAMAAGAIDIGDDAGTSLAFVAKGAPMIAVCESSSTLPLLAIGVPLDSQAKSEKDLKGKLIGVSNAGSLTDWLAQQFSIKEGWGPDGITRVAIGNTPASIAAAFKTHQVDADISEAGIFYKMEENKDGRLLATSFIHNSIVSGVLFASNKLIASNPDAIRDFLAAWLDTLDYMRMHKDETVTIESKLTGYAEPLEAKLYDIALPMYTKTCKFDADGIATLKKAFVDLKLVDGVPNMSKLYTEAYVPKP